MKLRSENYKDNGSIISNNSKIRRKEKRILERLFSVNK